MNANPLPGIFLIHEGRDTHCAQSCSPAPPQKKEDSNKVGRRHSIREHFLGNIK